jgi:Arc/MetJ-type ribon-helix-helix transcriptional regulator
MANKKNPDRVNKEHIIRVRVTNEDHEEFIKRAKENGYRSVSEFIRSLIADEPDEYAKNKV